MSHASNPFKSVIDSSSLRLDSYVLELQAIAQPIKKPINLSTTTEMQTWAGWRMVSDSLSVIRTAGSCGLLTTYCARYRNHRLLFIFNAAFTYMVSAHTFYCVYSALHCWILILFACRLARGLFVFAARTLNPPLVLSIASHARAITLAGDLARSSSEIRYLCSPFWLASAVYFRLCMVI